MPRGRVVLCYRVLADTPARTLGCFIQGPRKCSAISILTDMQIAAAGFVRIIAGWRASLVLPTGMPNGWCTRGWELSRLVGPAAAEWDTFAGIRHIYDEMGAEARTARKSYRSPPDGKISSVIDIDSILASGRGAGGAVCGTSGSGTDDAAASDAGL